MKIILAATWNPRGEHSRAASLLPRLLQIYGAMVITLPPDVDREMINALKQLITEQRTSERVKFILAPDWSWGRYLALQNSLDQPGDFIHYADFDRLLRWIETRPGEWQNVITEIQKWDCLIIARSQAAYDTHPQAIIQTEATSNLVTSFFLGMKADVSSGSKGFSRRAVEFLSVNARPRRAIGADAEWTVLLRRAGFNIGVMPVDGLDWESADQYQQQAAGLVEQRLAAEQYDMDPLHWAYRTEIALEIVTSALDAANQSIQPLDQLSFDLDSVFEVDDYMYFYSDMLTPERTQQQLDFLVRELELHDPQTILDLACGFGRHANPLAALGHRVIGVDLTPGFLEIAEREAKGLGVQVDYRQEDMRLLDASEEFDRVLLLFTAFGYFEDDENLRVLQNIARALKPAGMLIFDIQNRDAFLKDFLPFHVSEKEGNLMIDRHTFDSLTGRLHNQRIVIRDGMRRDKPFFVRLYNPSEIQALLSEAGLEMTRIFGGWDGSPISSDSRRMVIIAKKMHDGEKE